MSKKIKGNRIEFEGDLMYLHPINKPNIKFTLDKEDYNKIKNFNFSFTGNKYLISNKNKFNNSKQFYLHKYLLNIHDDKTKGIKFKDNNYFNLQKDNLVIVSKYFKERKGNILEVDKDIMYLYTYDKDKYILDAEDYEKVKIFTWSKDSHNYLYTNNPNTYLTSYLMNNTNKNNNIIFKNKNRHDYRKNNLEIIIDRNNKKSYCSIIEKDDYIIVIPTNSTNEYIFDKMYKEVLVNVAWKEYKRENRDTGYLRASIGKYKVNAHHLIIGQPLNGLMVDHKDQNTLNNRKSNLRIVTRSFNVQNKIYNIKNISGFTGVHWEKTRKRYIVKISHNRKSFYLGSFKNPVDAAKAYDKKALELYGEHATTNEKLNRYEIYYNNLNNPINQISID